MFGVRGGGDMLLIRQKRARPRRKLFFPRLLRLARSHFLWPFEVTGDLLLSPVSNGAQNLENISRGNAERGFGLVNQEVRLRIANSPESSSQACMTWRWSGEIDILWIWFVDLRKDHLVQFPGLWIFHIMCIYRYFSRAMHSKDADIRATYR